MKPGPAISTLAIASLRRQRGDDRLGDIARLLRGGLGQQERNVRREIAVFAALGALDDERRRIDGRQRAGGLQRGQSLEDRIAEQLFHGGIGIKPGILAAIAAFPEIRRRPVAAGVIGMSRSPSKVSPSAGTGGVRDAHVAVGARMHQPADAYAVVLIAKSRAAIPAASFTQRSFR